MTTQKEEQESTKDVWSLTEMKLNFFQRKRLESKGGMDKLSSEYSIFASSCLQAQCFDQIDFILIDQKERSKD